MSGVSTRIFRTLIKRTRIKDALTKNFDLTTTSTSADQLIGEYAITNLKDYLITALIIQVYLTTISATATLLGDLWIEYPDGTKILGNFQAVNPTSSAIFGFVVPIPEGMSLEGDGSKVVKATCTPATTTSTKWRVTIIGSLRDTIS